MVIAILPQVIRGMEIGVHRRRPYVDAVPHRGRAQVILSVPKSGIFQIMPGVYSTCRTGQEAVVVVCFVIYQRALWGIVIVNGPYTSRRVGLQRFLDRGLAQRVQEGHRHGGVGPYLYMNDGSVAAWAFRVVVIIAHLVHSI